MWKKMNVEHRTSNIQRRIKKQRPNKERRVYRLVFGLVYLAGLDEASLFKNDTKFLNFRHFRHFKL